MIRNPIALLAHIRAIHAAIRDAVVAACEATAIERLAVPVAEEAGDTIFAIDRVSEQVLLERFGELAGEWSCVLVAEGLGHTGQVVLPVGMDADRAELRVIVDPIDGTRGLMYQKRPAWVLTGVAPNRGPSTGLSSIELAVMTEIPLVKQHLCDTLWAVAGQGVAGERFNRLSGETRPLLPQPSRAASIAQGYGGIARFFPGARDVLAAIEEELIERVLGPQPPGVALAFEDQYISTGGQLYELIMGHDRWIADLRPLAETILRQRGKPLGLCCHPYDLCTELIARQAGVIVADARGSRLDAPLDVSTEVAWVGYANQAIFEQVAPVLSDLLLARGMLAAVQP
jgi:hypothetical protein